MSGNHQPVQTAVRIACPHCQTEVDNAQLPALKVRRNKYGSDIWGCPNCQQPFKVDTEEFTQAWQANSGKADGSYEPVVIQGHAEDFLMSSERDNYGNPKENKPSWFTWFPIALPIIFVFITLYFLNTYLG